MLGPLSVAGGRTSTRGNSRPPQTFTPVLAPAIPHVHRRITRKRPLLPIEKPFIDHQKRSRCETRAIGSATRVDYEKRYAAYLEWLRLRRIAMPRSTAELEVTLLRYLDEMLDNDLPANEGEKSVAAVKDAFPFATGPMSMPRVRRALCGFRKAKPPRSRPPFPKELVAGVISLFISWGHRDAALQVATMFFTYARPGEIRGLRTQDLLPPVRERGVLSMSAIVIAPQNAFPGDPQRTTKTGVTDDHISLDRPDWLGPALHHHARLRRPEDPLFTTPAHEMVRLFQKATAMLGVTKACLYQLRHGGASEDIVSRLRTSDEVKARGRWRSEASLRRYAKPAQLQRLLASIPPAKRVFARNAWEQLQQIVAGHIDATAPP
jgi:integrase